MDWGLWVETWGVNNPTTTQEHINKLIEFRQAVYEHGFRRRRDALFETLDALLHAGRAASFAMLSFAPGFKRQCHSLYKTLEMGDLDEAWLKSHLSHQVPRSGVQYFSLDGTAWPRPRARTLDDRQYAYHPTPAVNDGSICVGYPYSLLDWVPTLGTSRLLTVNVQRIPSTATVREIGVQQINTLPQPRTNSRLHTYSPTRLPRPYSIVAKAAPFLVLATRRHPRVEFRCQTNRVFRFPIRSRDGDAALECSGV